VVNARTETLEQVAALVERRPRRHTLRVAIDGVDAAGKTTFANDLAKALRRRDVSVVRASIDGFHHPASVRHRRAEIDPARSYYEDSFDYEALRDLLLEPLGEPGTHTVRTAIFDFLTDRPVDRPPALVAGAAVLLFDGVFLLRPELAGCWDLTVFLRVEADVALARAVSRDSVRLGNDVERRYRERYLLGQQLYSSAVRPEAFADIVIDTTDPARPVIVHVHE
jgi:uridine kinase